MTFFRATLTNPARVDPTGTTTQPVSIADSLPAGTNAIGKLAANNGVDIGDVTVNNGSGANAVNIQDGGNSITVDGTVSATAAGDVAHDGIDSGNPVKIGGKARTANPTAVANGDRVDAFYDKVGRPAVVVGQVRDLMVHQYTQLANTTQTTVLAAGGSGVFHDLTQLILTNASGTAVSVTFKDATSGTTRLVVDLAANGGAVIHFPRPLTQSASNNNWTATLSASSVTVNITVQAEKNV